MYKKYYGHKCDDHTQMMSNDRECRVRCGGWSLVCLETVESGHFKESFWRPVSDRPELRVLCL